MPSWFRIPAKFITDDSSDGTAVAINLDSVTFIIQDKTDAGEPVLDINMSGSKPLRLNGISLDAFLGLSITHLKAESAGESEGIATSSGT